MTSCIVVKHQLGLSMHYGLRLQSKKEKRMECSDLEGNWNVFFVLDQTPTRMDHFQLQYTWHYECQAISFKRSSGLAQISLWNDHHTGCVKPNQRPRCVVWRGVCVCVWGAGGGVYSPSDQPSIPSIWPVEQGLKVQTSERCGGRWMTGPEEEGTEDSRWWFFTRTPTR